MLKIIALNLQGLPTFWIASCLITKCGSKSLRICNDPRNQQDLLCLPLRNPLIESAGPNQQSLQTSWDIFHSQHFNTDLCPRLSGIPLPCVFSLISRHPPPLQNILPASWALLHLFPLPKVLLLMGSDCLSLQCLHYLSAKTFSVMPQKNLSSFSVCRQRCLY